MTMIKIGTDFESRNWLLLVRLTEMGFDKSETKKIAKKIEVGRSVLKIF